MTENVQCWKHFSGHRGDLKHYASHLVYGGNQVDRNWFAM